MCELFQDDIWFDIENIWKYQDYVFFDKNLKNILITKKSWEIIEMNLSYWTYKINWVCKSFSFFHISFDMILEEIWWISELDSILLSDQLKNSFLYALAKNKKYEIKQHKEYIKNSLYDLIDN